MVLGEYLCTEMEEDKAYKILLSIICLYSSSGMPLRMVDEEFKNVCGFAVPYWQFGAESLKSWIMTLPDIYLIHDDYGNELLIQQSRKSTHIKNMILRQKTSQPSGYYTNRNNYNTICKPNNKVGNRALPEGSFVHASINNTLINDSERFRVFEKLESMLPLFYKHQALGDDFFLDIADTKLGYYVPNNELKECGLCSSGQTIATLTGKVKNAEILAPRVVVMIGFQDLISGNNVNNMIYDLRQLVFKLKEKNTRVTLLTIPPSPKMPCSQKLESRLNIYNQAIMDYSCSIDLQCNTIDMNRIFMKEQASFRREFDRFLKVARNDSYKVFSDYGRKIFLSTLKACLKEQLEAGH